MSFKKEKISNALEKLKEKYGDKFTFSHSHPKLIEINLKNIDKGYGVNFVANRLKIKKDEIAAIGDSNNDLPLFEAASLKIAVKTNSKFLKEKASYYLDYKKHAVADAINKYIIDSKDYPIQLVASDLDGTLLENGTKRIHSSAKSAIEELVDKKNKIFVVCTGRSIDDAMLVANYFNVKAKKNIYAICVNGGCIYDVANKRYIHEKSMEPKHAKQIIEMFNTFQQDKTRQKQIALECFFDYDNDSLIKGEKQIHYMINKDFIYNYYLAAHPGMLKNF
jgi:hydroxymethylpyrimidine pyrophosphatase-like HAD family hydrolase